MTDSYDLWEARERELERALARLPVCQGCGRPIQEEHYYVILGEDLCRKCMEGRYQRSVEEP